MDSFRIQMTKYHPNDQGILTKSRCPEAMLAMMRTSPPHSLQASMSISNTRFNLCAQVIEARFSAGVWLAEWIFLRLPRLAGVTRAR